MNLLCSLCAGDDVTQWQRLSTAPLTAVSAFQMETPLTSPGPDLPYNTSLDEHERRISQSMYTGFEDEHPTPRGRMMGTSKRRPARDPGLPPNSSRALPEPLPASLLFLLPLPPAPLIRPPTAILN